MDIEALSMAMSQSKTQQAAGIAVMKMAMDTGKGNSKLSHSSFAMLPAIWWFLVVYVER